MSAETSGVLVIAEEQTPTQRQRRRLGVLEQRATGGTPARVALARLIEPVREDHLRHPRTAEERANLLKFMGGNRRMGSGWPTRHPGPSARLHRAESNSR